MLKKILAASSAAVVAVSALASTAMAATDEYTIEIETMDWYDTVTLDLSTTMTQDNMKLLLGNPANDVKDGWKDSGNSYSNIVLSVWEKKFTDLVGKTKDGKDAYHNSKDGWVLAKYSYNNISFGGATVKVDLAANVQDYYVIKAGDIIPANAPGNPTNDEADPADHVDYTVGGNGLLLPVGRKGGAAGFEWDTSTKNFKYEVDGKTLKVDTSNTEVGTTEVPFSKELTVSKDVKWTEFGSQSGAATNGYVTMPVKADGNFGLSATRQLVDINYNKSSVKVDFTVSMPGDCFRAMISSQTNAFWDWDNKTWSGATLQEIMNSQSGVQMINNYFGIVGQSWASDNNAVKGGVNQDTQEIKVEKSTYEDKSKAYGQPWNTKHSISLGVNATPTRLANMNNGGTITFEFNKEIPAGQFVSAEVVFRSDSGIANVPLDSKFTFAESGKTVTVDFPAGLTGGSTINPYNAFLLDYTIKGSNNGGWSWSGSAADPTFSGDPEIIKITIKANKEAPKDDNNSSNGGLVSDPSSSTSTPSNSSNTNSGTNSGDEKNPGTGVAVAVAPVVLAAAGAAVVISKKRK